uniref:Uncharacterized protein n=1 Tax=Rhizophora mucronata TaxID=61149 RepID=A0A2P2J1A5_RHIMU
MVQWLCNGYVKA